MFEFEQLACKQGYQLIAGIDEAGRGPLAGPVVAAAAMFPLDWLKSRTLPATLVAINDSKKLSPKIRDELFEALSGDEEITFACGIIDSEEIDKINILQATHKSMVLAAMALSVTPDFILVDGLPVATLPTPNKNVIKGDQRSILIAAASIVAKVTRDRIMVQYDRDYPEYGFAKHKGYGTTVHLAALNNHGPCPIHRRSFRPVREAC